MAASEHAIDQEQNRLFRRLCSTFLRPIDVNETYEIDEEIGHGAFGAVCKVLNRHTGEVGAMKTLKLDQTTRADKNLESEVMTLVELRAYDNIVKVFDIFMGVDDQLHLVMELCDGDLAGHMSSQDNHEPLSLFNMAQQAAKGLDVLHSHSPPIIHRDIKPQNILISRDHSTNELVVKLADFGISRNVETHDITASTANAQPAILTDVIRGTQPYWAPEYCAALDGVGMKDGKNCFNASVDIFALGLVYAYIFCYNNNRYGKKSYAF